MESKWSRSGKLNDGLAGSDGDYIWNEINDNLCDRGSDLICVVRGVESRKRRGKNNLRLWEKL